ncbi:hypothetical protein ACN9NO_11355, partial [Glaesserella parasuis]|uniref:hypothetical protein n=1 Tax=Glaesserella parasuis TaxID=738 RepID=UPI0024364847
YLRLCYLIHCQCLTFPQVITPLELWLSHSLLIPSHLWQAVRFLSKLCRDEIMELAAFLE